MVGWKGNGERKAGCDGGYICVGLGGVEWAGWRLVLLKGPVVA